MWVQWIKYIKWSRINSIRLRCLSTQAVRGCLHESLSFNPDRTRSVSFEIIGDWIKFVYMNPDWVATSSFHFSFRIEHSIWNEMSIRSHVNLDQDFTLKWNSTFVIENEIGLRYCRNNDCLENSKFSSRNKIVGTWTWNEFQFGMRFSFAVIFQSSTQSSM